MRTRGSTAGPIPVRPTTTDVWLTGAVVVVSIVLTLLAAKGPPYRGVDAFGLAIAAASALCLIWRQVMPMAVLAITGTVVIVNAAVGYPVDAVQWPVWIALFTCFGWYGWRRRALSLAIVGLGVAGYIVFDRGPVGAVQLVSITVSILVATIVGDAARSRRAWAAAIEARLRGEARERTMLADHMLVQERGRAAVAVAIPLLAVAQPVEHHKMVTSADLKWEDVPSLPPGAKLAVIEGPKTHHFAWTKEPTVVQLHGTGPWGITYLDPNDDPRKKAN